LIKLIEIKRRSIIFSDFEDEIGTGAAGWHVSGVLRFQAGKPDVAIEHGEAALRLSPRARVGSTFFMMGSAHFLGRRFDEAVPKLLGDLIVGCFYLSNGNSAPGPKFDCKLRRFERLTRRARRIPKSRRSLQPRAGVTCAVRVTSVGAVPGRAIWRERRRRRGFPSL
jgi:hypothetical protein